MISFTTYDGNQLILRSPDLGDLWIIDLKTKQKYAMSGQIYKYKLGEASQRLSLIFSNLTRNQRLATETFIKNNITKVVKYTNDVGESVNCRFLGDVVNIQDNGRDNCGFTIELEYSNA